jgi:two-component system cell cycle sensor histidine kinase PleC
LRIISDILDMARLDAGQIEIDREPLHLDLLVHETLQSYSEEAERGGIDVMTDTVPGLTLHADGGAVRQICPT